VLQTAEARLVEGHQEQVLVEGGAVEQIDLGLADARHVAGNAIEVGFRQRVGEHHAVKHAAGGELALDEIGDLDRVIDQRLVIRGGVAAKPAFVDADRRQRGRHAPSVRQFMTVEHDLVARTLRAMHPQEDAGAVEEGVAGINVRAAYREIGAVDAVAHRHGVLARGEIPGLLVDRREHHRLAAGILGVLAHEMPGEVAQQIASRDPGRQAQSHPIGAGRQAQLDVDVPTAIPAEGEPVARFERRIRCRDGHQEPSPGRLATDESLVIKWCPPG